MTKETIAAINAFWLGESQSSPEAGLARKDWWYRGGEIVDNEIRARFGQYVELACQRKLMDWAESGDGALASILLLDQFTRNIYRHTPAAYGGDACAFEIVKAVVAKGLDHELHPVSRVWLYHPFHHSQQLVEQDNGLSLLEQLKASSSDEWQPYVQHSINGWTRHRNIVARFGRFPHRNEVLGRESTEEELAFLSKGAEAFGQGKK
ncbi:MAG: DUF924 domain-containing protein [Hyphomicrobiaceae bacterium TMED74]|nr:hypothetical protein [Filomicrobium sp.]RPG38103.1 MAG: DUF924 domain-containing protein [Hyphomicrobiaceae bacterium TMED74]